MEIGSKLSKNMLSMKFMRKTKDHIDRVQQERKHREHFDSSKSDSFQVPTESIVEERPSYSQCIGYTYARLSFGGFNKVVEYNVSKGKWKPEYAEEKYDQDGNVINEHDDEEDAARKARAQETDIPDEEMAKAYGSLIATVGRKFINKRIRGDQYRYNDNDKDKDLDAETKIINKRIRGDHYRFNDNDEIVDETKIKMEKPSSSQNQIQNQRNRKIRNQNKRHNQNELDSSVESPPVKRARFIKPSD